jgi:hypothetical protein
VNCVPDLPGVGGQVDLGVAVVVEDAVLLGVQVADQTVVVIAVVVEEGFVGADDFGVLDQALPDASAQPDETLHAIGRHEGIAEDGVGLLADAVHAARALDQADDGPGQVVVDDDVRVLQVLAFGQHVSGDEHAQFVGLLDLLTLVVGLRREAPGQGCGVGALAGGFGHLQPGSRVPRVAYSGSVRYRRTG